MINLPRWARPALIATVLAGALPLCPLFPGVAIPPPPERPPQALVLPGDGCTVSLKDEVRAYDYVLVTFAGEAGDTLNLQLTDSQWLLRFNIDAPSGSRLIETGISGPRAFRLLLPETGRYRLYVVMIGDAARRGTAAKFTLDVSRQSKGGTLAPLGQPCPTAQGSQK
jgi:hypothetical protein